MPQMASMGRSVSGEADGEGMKGAVERVSDLGHVDAASRFLTNGFWLRLGLFVPEILFYGLLPFPGPSPNVTLISLRIRRIAPRASLDSALAAVSPG